MPQHYRRTGAAVVPRRQDRDVGSQVETFRAYKGANALRHAMWRDADVCRVFVDGSTGWRRDPLD
jgi:hypothetical protein